MKTTQLTIQQIQQYKQDGFLSGLRAADAEEARRYQKLYDEIEAVEGRDKCQIGLTDRHFDIPFVWEIASNRAILDSIEALIGPDIMLMSTHFFCKYGPSTKFVAWHQDVTYWCIEPEIAISAWYAVDDVDPGNGGMQMIPGSHRLGIVEHGKANQDGNLLSVNQEVVVPEEDAKKAVDIVLKAGEFSLHDGLTLHGSQPNLSTRRRCGVTNVYIPAHVRQTKAHVNGYWSGVMMRGVNRSPSFKEKPQPFAMVS